MPKHESTSREAQFREKVAPHFWARVAVTLWETADHLVVWQRTQHTKWQLVFTLLQERADTLLRILCLKLRATAFTDISRRRVDTALRYDTICFHENIRRFQRVERFDRHGDLLFNLQSQNEDEGQSTRGGSRDTSTQSQRWLDQYRGDEPSEAAAAEARHEEEASDGSDGSQLSEQPPPISPTLLARVDAFHTERAQTWNAAARSGLMFRTWAV